MKKLLLGLLMVFAAILQAEEVSAYLRGAHKSVADTKAALKAAGYEVVAVYQPVAQGTTIVVTDAGLKKAAAKKGRAFAAILRVFVDDKEKKISATNPVYFGKAFMQDDYDSKLFSEELAKINKALPGMEPSQDKLDADDLASYHFMMGMPYYEDSIELAKQPCSKSLAKLKSYNGGKNVVFILDLSEKSHLVGFDLSDKTEAFVETIGRDNAALLPWTIAVEHGKAMMLHPKYYIALSYPNLSMGEFMKIRSTPGEIEDEIEAAFK